MANTKQTYEVAYKVINSDGLEEKVLWVSQIKAVSAASAIKRTVIEFSVWYGIDMSFDEPVSYGRTFALAHTKDRAFCLNNVLTASVV